MDGRRGGHQWRQPVDLQIDAGRGQQACHGGGQLYRWFWQQGIGQQQPNDGRCQCQRSAYRRRADHGQRSPGSDADREQHAGRPRRHGRGQLSMAGQWHRHSRCHIRQLHPHPGRSEQGGYRHCELHGRVWHKRICQQRGDHGGGQCQRCAHWWRRHQRHRRARPDPDGEQYPGRLGRLGPNLLPVVRRWSSHGGRHFDHLCAEPGRCGQGVHGDGVLHRRVRCQGGGDQQRDGCDRQRQ